MSASLADLVPLAEIDGTATGAHPVDNGDAALTIVADDGSIEINVDPHPKSRRNHFGDNIADDLDPGALASAASQLATDIDADNQSRQQWLDMRTQGLALLGLELLQPRGDVGASSAPLEGMSTVVSPLLLGEVLRAQATARGELLPAGGPVKVRDDAPGRAERGELADALERDFNVYLTQVCTEYYPDTDRMLFHTAFGGAGFKKIYHCPIRNRPVSESVDAADLIINAGATDLANARRITHVIRMRDSEVRRMVIAGAWRDVSLGPASYQPEQVKEREAQIAGVSAQPATQRDQDHTIYETIAELDLGEGPDGMPLPYRVTFDKDSKAVLDVRRNWREGDKLYRAKQMYVRFPYIDAIGIYGIGLLHLLGNTSRALTAAEREMLDAGMFANFPGFLYADSVARQDTNEFRVPPGGGVKIQLGGARAIGDAVMPLPYKSIQPTLLQFCELLQKDAAALAGSAEIPLGEGKATLPVGTILASLEQATRPMSAVHKRLHAAQAEEFRLLAELLREDPEAFWKHGRRNVYEWDKETFLRALDTYELAPVSDPNEPTRSHRILKAQAIKMLQMQNPELYDAEAVDSHVLRLLGVGQPDEFFRKQSMAPQPNPQMELVKARMQEAQASLAQKQRDSQLRLVEARIRAQTDALNARARERVDMAKIEVEKKKIGADLAIAAAEGHSDDIERQQNDASVQAGL